MLLDKKIWELYGQKPLPEDQEIGIEIEVEGENVLHEGILSHWLIDKDGSLRGDSAEYKLKQPVKRDNVLKVLLYLYKKLAEHKTKIKDSQRTGVHVHVNIQQLTIKQLYQFITLYLSVEELMVRHAGKNRVGNLFCLRASDAEGLVEYLVNALRDDRADILHNDNLRYASLNVKAIQQFGSLEFRALKGGVITPEEIATWAKMLLEIKDASLKYENPREIIEQISVRSPVVFVSDIGPTVAYHLVKGSKLSNDDIDSLVYVGVRLAQEVAYCNKWKEPKKKPPEEAQPFIVIDEVANLDPERWEPADWLERGRVARQREAARQEIEMQQLHAMQQALRELDAMLDPVQGRWVRR